MNWSLAATLALTACLSASTLAAETPVSPPDRLETERLEQSGTVISIIFDDSGSMAGTKINQAKAAFREWIKAVPPSYRLGLVALNAGPLVPINRDNRPALLAAVNQLRASGGTPLVTTIRSALAEIDRRRGVVGPYERQILLVFTDGEDTTAEGIPGVQRELQRARNVNIETVGIGYHGEGTYLRTATTRYYDAKNLAELQRSLAKVDAEIGDTSDIVIDERTRATMQLASAPAAVPVAKPVTTTLETTSPPPSPSSHSTPAHKRSNRSTWIITAVVVWLVLRSMINAKRNR